MPTQNKLWRQAFSQIGELILLASAIDHQLTHIVIEVLHLTKSTMLEPVIATLDSARKVEILKGRLKHIHKNEWKEPISKYVDLVERVNRCRNMVCHSQMIEVQGKFVFSSSQAAKLFKGLRLEGVPTVDRLGMDAVVGAISIAEKALGKGEDIISNFQRVSAALNQRALENKKLPNK